jgi:hypothetical protein
MDYVNQGVGLIVYIILIVIASTRKELKGKGWLIAAILLILVNSLSYPIFIEFIESGVIKFLDYSHLSISLHIIYFSAFCLLIPYVIIAGSKTSSGSIEKTGISAEKQEALAIGGWLVLPAIALILSPIITISGFVISFVLMENTVDAGLLDHLYFASSIDVGILIFVIFAATRFFKKKANTPTVMIAFLIFQVLVLAVCSVIFLFAEAGTLVSSFIREFALALIAAIIWIPYFKVSKRVKETFVN